MGCIPAPLCKKALNDATDSFPGRARGSDGICGDARHQAIQSDHNLGDAFDLTHDPKAGCDAHGFADIVRKQKPRWCKYIISKGRIWSLARDKEGWRNYHGSNPHNVHAHFSIYHEYRNDAPVFPWTKGASTGPTEEEELMAAKDEIISSVNGHTTVSNAYQGQSSRVLYLFGQLHRWDVTPTGSLRHQWHDSATESWNVDTWAEDCKPFAIPDIHPNYQNQLHVFVEHVDDDKVVHAFMDLKTRQHTQEVIVR